MNEQELKLKEIFDVPRGCRGRPSPMVVARRLVAYRESSGISQQELGRRLGVTAGMLHHYESLVRHLAPDLAEHVDRGDLTFKEGRAIADLKSWERQREIAKPFISGKYSSGLVEQVVMWAKRHPGLSVEALSADVERRQRKGVTPEAPSLPPEDDLTSLRSLTLDLAGRLASVNASAIPEYERFGLLTELRILEQRLDGAMRALSPVSLGGDGLR